MNVFQIFSAILLVLSIGSAIAAARNWVRLQTIQPDWWRSSERRYELIVNIRFDLVMSSMFLVCSGIVYIAFRIST